jgi:hypothetical protein
MQVIFHVNERDDIPPNPIVDENFAGFRVLGSEPGSNSSTSTIRSHRGTIRGVKNRVRAGIATFLRDQRAKVKPFSTPGTDVIIFKIFSPKKSAKKLAFFTKNKAKLCKILIITLVFEKNANFFAEN